MMTALKLQVIIVTLHFGRVSESSSDLFFFTDIFYKYIEGTIDARDCKF